MRPLPPGPPALSDLPPLDAAPETETWTIRLRTITPMFGGGATAREVDPVVPIRAAAIRGHLRFWWRATAGSAFADARELFQAEEAIWGSANKPGPVALQVTIDSAGKPRKFSLNASQQDGPLEGYFLFPFAEEEYKQGDRRPSKFAEGLENVQFTLTLSVPSEMRDDVQRAVRAWILFGGVGARTRRGVGSLGVVGDDAALWLPPPVISGLELYLRDLARDVAPPQGMPKLPRLKWGTALFGDIEPDAMTSWRKLGRFWSRFRKGHFTQKHPNYQPTKDGDWLDHSTLLRLHSVGTDVALAKPFFGLPIEYQYFAAKNGHPAAFEGSIRPKLQNQKSDRMASPIILKPVQFADGSIRPMVAVLRTPLPRAILVKDRSGREVERQLRAPAGDTEPVLTALNSQHPLEAVQNAARKCGFSKRVDL